MWEWPQGWLAICDLPSAIGTPAAANGISTITYLTSGVTVVCVGGVAWERGGRGACIAVMTYPLLCRRCGCSVRSPPTVGFRRGRWLEVLVSSISSAVNRSGHLLTLGEHNGRKGQGQWVFQWFWVLCVYTSFAFQPVQDADRL